MKKIINILIFCLLFTIPNVVKAEFWLCEQADIVKLQKIASNVTTTYEYNETFPNGEKYGIVNFTIYINNLDPRIYIYDRNSKMTYRTEEKQLILYNVQPGSTLELTIFGDAYNCSDEELITIHVSVPSYNKYYMDDLCVKYPNNKLCYKWGYMDMSYEEFRKRILISEIKEEVIEEPVDDKKTFKDYFVDVIVFLDKYKFFIFGTMIIGSILGIIIIKLIKRRDEFDLK